GTSKGVAHYNGSVMTIYNKSNTAISEDSIHTLQIDKDGFPVCISYEKRPVGKYINYNDRNIAIYHFDGAKWNSFIPANSSYNEGWKTSSFCIDLTQRLWFPTYSNGIIRYQDTTRENITTSSTPPLLSNNTYQIACDNFGTIWCLNSIS